MKKVNDYLLVAIFVMTALLLAVAGLKTYSGYMKEKELAEEMERQKLEELMARNTEAQNRVQEMQAEISGMAGDIEVLQLFIDDTVAAANEVQSRKEAGSVSENSVLVLSTSVSGNGTISDNVAFPGDETESGEATVSGNETESGEVTVSGNETDPGNVTVSGNETEPGNMTVSGNEVELGNMTVSGNETEFGNMTVSGNEAEPGNVTVSGNETVSGNGSPFGFPAGSVSANNGETSYDDVMSLEERKALRTSYEETLEVNQTDREWLAENQYDFSQMKIACLGDSITAAANLEGEENYEQYAYPAKLQELLGAGEVYNLGVGGSSIGRYWSDAFVDRYEEIPEDTDIIIVMGGTNDGFCVSDDEFGSLDERAYRTFCGDLDELMSGLRERYPETVIFFATPLPNVLHDYLMSEREYLIPQKNFVEVIRTLAQEYDFELVDLYNSNILDSHDANVITEYMPDGVHGNPDGYQILAEHFASEIVKYYNEDMREDSDEMADTDMQEDSDEKPDTDIQEETDEKPDADMQEEIEDSLDEDRKEETDGNIDANREEGTDGSLDENRKEETDGSLDADRKRKTDNSLDMNKKEEKGGSANKDILDDVIMGGSMDEEVEE